MLAFGEEAAKGLSPLFRTLYVVAAAVACSTSRAAAATMLDVEARCGVPSAAADVTQIIEDEAEAEVGDPVGEEVAGPDGEAGYRGGGALAHGAHEDEKHLEEKAHQHRHPDLPVAVLLWHRRVETHRRCRRPPLPAGHACMHIQQQLVNAASVFLLYSFTPISQMSCYCSVNMQFCHFLTIEKSKNSL